MSQFKPTAFEMRIAAQTRGYVIRGDNKFLQIPGGWISTESTECEQQLWAILEAHDDAAVEANEAADRQIGHEVDER